MVLMYTLKTFLVLAVAVIAATDLRTKYPFSAVLLNDANRGYYTLHWNFTRETKMIYFAVNASTAGWVGYGLSPNGGMVGSDVVIGWVNKDGAAYFKDRYAMAEALPPADSNQDWCLTSAKEEDGYTILEFNRNFTTCDDRDRDITGDTARVVWSFNPNDPLNDEDDNLMYHTARGSASLDLLGGNPNQQLVGNEPYLDITVSNVEIPSAPTTYWCATYRLPSDFINTTHFITQISPSITPHTREFVHHLIVYLCPSSSNLTAAEIGHSGRCYFNLSTNARNCFGNVVLGGWAVGGDDFVYPEGISYPIGGIGEEQFVVIEMHYDNPNQRTGVMDSSGLRFYYNTEEPIHRAGILLLGHDVTPFMIIPPRNGQYTITSVCSAECTSRYIPEEGITVIGDLLHTHLAGKSITISHYRRNATTNQLVELEPLDQNINYDFNFQQFTHFSAPRKVLPGDILVMQCTYDTRGRASITLGGLSTYDEMCSSFPVFYPRPADRSAIARCSSSPDATNAFFSFSSYVINNNLATVDNLTSNFFSTLETLDWAGDPMLATSLRDSLLKGNVTSTCFTESSNRSDLSLPVPLPDVPYVAPDICSGVPKGLLGSSCLKDGNQVGDTGGAPPLVSASVFVIVVAVLHSVSTTFM